MFVEDIIIFLRLTFKSAKHASFRFLWKLTSVGLLVVKEIFEYTYLLESHADLERLNNIRIKY